MAAVEAAITKVFIDIALSTGVDVLTRRADSPTIRGLGRAYRVYTLVSPAEGIYNALRISAYSDAASLLAHESVVEFSSQAISKTLLKISAANYEIHRQAERYVLSPEFADSNVDSAPLSRWLWPIGDLPKDNFYQNGKVLSDLVSSSVSRAVRARQIAVDLTNYPEARVARPYRNWDRQLNWADRTNFALGSILWRPVPEIGLGSRSVSDLATYSGIFRRNDAEGYGCVLWTNGDRYFGQTRYGRPEGYGVYYFKSGRVYAGGIARGGHHLGAYWSPNRDWIYYGEFRGTTADGFGRRVGLANGVQSVSGLWNEGELQSEFPDLAGTYKNIVTRMVKPEVRTVRVKYEQLATAAQRLLDASDTEIVTQMKSLI